MNYNIHMRGPRGLYCKTPPLPLCRFPFADIIDYRGIEPPGCDETNAGVKDDAMAYGLYQVESQTRILFPFGHFHLEALEFLHCLPRPLPSVLFRMLTSLTLSDQETC